MILCQSVLKSNVFLAPPLVARHRTRNDPGADGDAGLLSLAVTGEVEIGIKKGSVGPREKISVCDAVAKVLTLHGRVKVIHVLAVDARTGNVEIVVEAVVTLGEDGEERDRSKKGLKERHVYRCLGALTPISSKALSLSVPRCLRTDKLFANH
jgi:hypothetical protein